MSIQKETGIDQKIIRRDFLQGFAIGMGALGLGCQTGGLFSKHSHSLSTEKGFNGQCTSSQQLGHFVRDSKHLSISFLNSKQTFDSHYDLIVVGAGLAGLSAAFTFQLGRNHKAKILVLDNSKQLFGHARINAFQYNGKKYIAPGGAYALESPQESPEVVVDLFAKIGLNLDTLKSYRDENFFSRHKLSSALLMDPRTLDVPRLSWATGFHTKPYRDFFSASSLPNQLKKDLIKFYESKQDYLPHIKDKESYLKSITWKQFILKHMQLDPEVCKFANIYATDLCGLGCDAVSAWDGFLIGPGFYGMGGEGFFENKKGVLEYAYKPKYRFPDGNFSVAKLLLNKLIPTSLIPKANNMDQVFNSSIDYSKLDQPSSNTKIRLNMMATKVMHHQESNAKKVRVEYINKQGKRFESTADHVVVTSWGMVNKYIIPELATRQKSSLNSYLYTPSIYINVLLKNWKPMASLGAFDMYLPGGYCSWMNISDPLSVPPYSPSYKPESPTILSMYKYLFNPNHPPETQVKLGRVEMESKTFRDYELEVRQELNYLFGPQGFDASRDIAGIMINRWAHGYNFFKSPQQDRNAFKIGKKRIGKISFAGADTGGEPWAQAAISEGIRAAREQLDLT